MIVSKTLQGHRTKLNQNTEVPTVRSCRQTVLLCNTITIAFTCMINNKNIEVYTAFISLKIVHRTSVTRNRCADKFNVVYKINSLSVYDCIINQ